MADNRSNNVVAIVAIIVIVLVAGVVLYYVLGGGREPVPVPEANISETIIEVEPPEETSPSPAIPAQEGGTTTDAGQEGGGGEPDEGQEAPQAPQQ